MSGPTVFISYSHQDEIWKDQLVRQLRVLELEGAYDIWEDRQIAEWAEKAGWSLLTIALNHLTLGRAHRGLALTASGKDRTAGLAQTAEQLDRAVEGLRRAGREDYLPRGLLARAALRRFRFDFVGAVADLTEALEIAERGRCGCTSATRTSNGRASAGITRISPRPGGMWRGRGSW